MDNVSYNGHIMVQSIYCIPNDHASFQSYEVSQLCQAYAWQFLGDVTWCRNDISYIHVSIFMLSLLPGGDAVAELLILTPRLIVFIPTGPSNMFFSTTPCLLPFKLVHLDLCPCQAINQSPRSYVEPYLVLLRFLHKCEVQVCLWCSVH